VNSSSLKHWLLNLLERGDSIRCKDYEKEIEALKLKLGSKHNKVFITSRDKIIKVIDEIKSEFGNIFTEEVIKCYVYEELSLGELTPLIMDDNLEEIMVVARERHVFVYNRLRGMTPTQIFIDEEKIRKLIGKIAKYSGRKISNASPLLDARLPDGSRVNATLQGVSPRGSTITIRKFRREPLTITDLIRYGTLSAYSAAFLWLAVEGMHSRPANIIVIGGTASGKTTTLNALSSFIPEDERIISIEDVLEINLAHEHWIPLETRPPDSEGNEITMDDLLKNALRMRPDRMIVGEVRAEEALTLFTAMNTGHDGCIATLHANSARETLNRLRSHPMNVPDIMIPALNLIVSQRRQVEKGKVVRRVFEIVEISGTEGNNILTNTLFKFDIKSEEIKEVILSGRYIEELSTLNNMRIIDIKTEISRREALLELMVEKNLNSRDIHNIIQLYYNSPDMAMNNLIHSTTDSGVIMGRSGNRRGLLGI